MSFLRSLFSRNDDRSQISPCDILAKEFKDRRLQKKERVEQASKDLADAGQSAVDVFSSALERVNRRNRGRNHA